MVESKKHKEECGPFIACGAACISFDHEPGQPTSYDRVADTIKRFFNGSLFEDRRASKKEKEASDKDVVQPRTYRQLHRIGL